MPGTPRALRSFGVGAAKGSAMAARAYWKGQIRLALVSIPVEIYAATKSGAAISFRQIHEPSGKPVKYRSEEHTSELQSLMRLSYAVFCLKKKTNQNTTTIIHKTTYNIQSPTQKQK